MMFPFPKKETKLAIALPWLSFGKSVVINADAVA
jgi:hypothetical protein